MGDVHTGDGIERTPHKPGTQSLLTPLGGEGGSVLRALGSKEVRALARKTRRDLRKTQYSKYLESSTWRKIRARVLKRDKHKCLACGAKAEVVHHVRYPAILGQEKLDWLYSLCREHHDQIHRMTSRTVTLREATFAVVGIRTPVTGSPSKGKQPLTPKKKKRRTRKQPGTPPATLRKRTKLQLANDALHERQVQIRENQRRVEEEKNMRESLAAFLKERAA